MKKTIKINVLQLLIIILVLFFLVSYIIHNFSTDISTNLNMAFKVLTNQIDLENEIIENETILGLTDVQGEGIIISVLDGKDLIHQEDLIILIDELKNSGSQAISINEKRITNSSYLYCDGAVILLDGEKIGNPFTIKAIGNSETLYGAMTRNKGYITTLEKDEIEIKIEKSSNIKIKRSFLTSINEYSNGKSKFGALVESEKLVGKLPVSGNGIQIRIYENSVKLSALSFLQIINDLKVGGAKAISLNGNRITSLTDIVDISSTYVLVNSIPIDSPYIINVVGDKDKLLQNLNYNNSYINKIRAKGNNVEIYKSSRIFVDKYNQIRDKDKMNIDYLSNI